MRDSGATRGQRATLTGTMLGYGCVLSCSMRKLREEASTLTMRACGYLHPGRAREGDGQAGTNRQVDGGKGKPC